MRLSPNHVRVPSSGVSSSLYLSCLRSPPPVDEAKGTVLNQTARDALHARRSDTSTSQPRSVSCLAARDGAVDRGVSLPCSLVPSSLFRLVCPDLWDLT